MKYGIVINLITIDDESSDKHKTQAGGLSVVFDTEEEMWLVYHQMAAAVCREFRCPDCQGNKFIEGPHGGLSINFCCADCGARFNDSIGWIDRVQAEGNEREWFDRRKGWYQPRCSEIRMDYRNIDGNHQRAIGSGENP